MNLFYAFEGPVAHDKGLVEKAGFLVRREKGDKCVGYSRRFS